MRIHRGTAGSESINTVYDVNTTHRSEQLYNISNFFCIRHRTIMMRGSLSVAFQSLQSY